MGVFNSVVWSKEWQTREHLCKFLPLVQGGASTGFSEDKQILKSETIPDAIVICGMERQNEACCIHGCTKRRRMSYMKRLGEGRDDQTAMPGKIDSELIYSIFPSKKLAGRCKRTRHDSCTAFSLGHQGACSGDVAFFCPADPEDHANGIGCSVSSQRMHVQEDNRCLHFTFELIAERMIQSNERSPKLDKEAIPCVALNVPGKEFLTSLESVQKAVEKTAIQRVLEHLVNWDLSISVGNSDVWNSDIPLVPVMSRIEETEALEFLPAASADRVCKVYSRKSKRLYDRTQSIDCPYILASNRSLNDSAIHSRDGPGAVTSRAEFSVSSCNVQSKKAMNRLILVSTENDLLEINMDGRVQDATLPCSSVVSNQMHRLTPTKTDPGLMPLMPNECCQVTEAMQSGSSRTLLLENYSDGVFSIGILYDTLEKLVICGPKEFWLRGDKELFKPNFSTSIESGTELGNRKERKKRFLLGSLKKNPCDIKFSVPKRQEEQLIDRGCNKLPIIREEVIDIAGETKQKKGEQAYTLEDDERHTGMVGIDSMDVQGGVTKLTMFNELIGGFYDATENVESCGCVKDKINHFNKGLEGPRGSGSTSKRRKILEMVLPTEQRGIKDGVYLQTRSNSLSCMRKSNGQFIRTGPILRSRQGESVKTVSFLDERIHRRCNSQIIGKHKALKKAYLNRGAKNTAVRTLLEKYLRNRANKLGAGNDLPNDCLLPFLIRGSRRMVECFCCQKRVFSGQGVFCIHKGCHRAYHRLCAMGLRQCSWHKTGRFTCPQHVCMVCKRIHKGKLLQCERCPVAAHTICLAFPDHVLLFPNKAGRMICWRHSDNWRTESKHKLRTSDIQEVFCRLPLPYIEEDFNISSDLKEEVAGNDSEPAPYIHIRRNVFLIKKRRDDADDGVGCTCSNACQEDCECRVQSMSCSKTCNCKEHCTNKPFRKDKRIKLVKTELCGWGAISMDSIKKGEFIIEYIGEVINEAICEDRLWTMKGRGVHNFYMCEIEKDFIIDATFKGNPSRFLNHSCDPNCKLEKWRVDGETRVGVFALRDISFGEILAYDYRYIQFGSNVKCNCGSAKCRGDLGEQFGNQRVKTSGGGMLAWGHKQKRSCLRSRLLGFRSQKGNTRGCHVLARG